MAYRFPESALKQPLFIGDVQPLRAKLERAEGLLRSYWRDYNTRILAQPDQRREMIFLSALLADEHTGEAASLLREYYRTLQHSDAAGDVQFHTWCRGGSVTRRVAFFDWLACKGAWNASDVEEAAEAFIGFAFKHSFQVLTSRTRTSNNQALSMALNCAVTGFLFGHKLANHPTARFLFEYGTGRLPDLIGLFPGDGYGGEGSTYTSHVNTPLTYWIAEFLSQISGQSALDTPFQPNGTTLGRMLDMELHILSPGGLLAPWDHYGWQPAINASPFAYMARAHNNPRYLSVIPAFSLWEHPGYLAWGADDPMWTLIWWPDAFAAYDGKDVPEELFGWFLPKTGAALDDCRRRSRLMQVWDSTSDTVAGIGRAQCNPNHVIFDCGGEPVFQDGVQVPNTGDPWGYPPEKVFGCLSNEKRDRFLKYLTSFGAKVTLESITPGLAPGLVGSANAIVIDGEGWYWPGEARVGIAEFYGTQDGLQAVTADSAPIYSPRYDVRRMRRTSIWTPAGFGLILDTIEASSTHEWCWQVYTRPDVTMEPNAIHIGLPRRESVLLAWGVGPAAKSTLVEHFPNTQEKHSRRLELRQCGSQATFTVLVAPGARQAAVTRHGSLVEVTIDGTRHVLAVENFASQPVTIDGRRTTAPFAWSAGSRCVELRPATTPRAVPDVHHLEDISADCDIQTDLFRALTTWDFTGRLPTASAWLTQANACWAQAVASQPDTALLLRTLQGADWTAQVAAAEVLGRRGIQTSAPALRRLLTQEHQIPNATLYPPDGHGGTQAGKRWRLKTALIIALGRLRDAEAIPLLGQLIRDNRDFYPVYSTAVQALARIGGTAAAQALAPALDDSEHNTYLRAHFAAEHLGVE